MDRQDNRRAWILSLLLFLLFSHLPAWAEERSASGLIEQADGLWHNGDTQKAIQVLRVVRERFPGGMEEAESLALSIDICLASKDSYRARYFLSTLMREVPGSSYIFSSALRIADFLYRENSSTTALEYYTIAVQEAGADCDASGLDRALLRLSELTLYAAGDVEAARYYFQMIEPDGLPPQEATAFRALSSRLNWQVISGEALGLGDENISSLRMDGDDLWIGTWNGGVTRYSVGSGECTPFPLPATMSRCIEIFGSRVWVGTAEGLAWFSKPTSRWGPMDVLGSVEAPKVQALCALGDELYAGTLGNGLMRMRDEVWEQVGDDELPGEHITCLAAESGNQRLLIGTMAKGLLILDRRTGELSRLADTHPEFTALNVTAILPDSQGRIWIGTYGDGLFLWTGGPEEIRCFTKSEGEIGDDWILCACETPKGIYFGSFGGGVSFLSAADGSWRRLGITDGLASLDITSIARRGASVFFGTLGAGICRYFEGPSGSGDGAKF